MTADFDFSAQEEGMPLVSSQKGDINTLKLHKELTTREIAAYGFYLAPIWFVTGGKYLLCLVSSGLLILFRIGYSLVSCLFL